MDKNKILEVINNAENKSNKDLMSVIQELESEHTKTKEIIINLTHHLESIENFYNIVNKELSKRIVKP
jgi:hypothetical protein